MRVTNTTYWDDKNYIDINDNNIIILESTQAVIKWLKENNYYYSGITYQNGLYTVPIINDSWLFQVSQRQWGKIIAQAFPEKTIKYIQKERTHDLSYCIWAWESPEEEHLPNVRKTSTPLSQDEITEIFLENYN